MPSEYTVGELVRKRECDHVILSEAKDQRAANRGLPPGERRLTFLPGAPGAREASLASRPAPPPEMLRAHLTA